MVGGFQGSITLYDTVRDRQLAAVRGDNGDPASVAVSPDGALLVASEGSAAVLWDLPRRRRLGRLRGHSAAVAAMITRLSCGTCHRDHVVLRHGRSAQRSAQAVAFSPDGRILASAGAGGGNIPVILLSVHGRRRLARLSGHTGAVWRLAFGLDGRMLASAGANRVIVWDVDSARTLATLGTHDDLSSALAFSPDGAILATPGRTRASSSGILADGQRSQHCRDIRTAWGASSSAQMEQRWPPPGGATTRCFCGASTATGGSAAQPGMRAGSSRSRSAQTTGIPSLPAASTRA